MSYIDSIILGIIQGVTEFLPVSSSGHLAVMKFMLGLADVPVLYDILLHISTLLVMILVFWKRIVGIIVSLWRLIIGRRREEDKENLWLLLLIVAATAITAIVGVGLSNTETKIASNPLIIGVLFIVTGLFLLLTLLFKGDRSYKQMSIWNAFVIGFFQGIGVLPGISRSGITITASLGSKVDRRYAGEFSFLIAIPAILGALFLKSGEAQSLLNTVSIPVLITGFVVTFIVGLFSLLLLLKIIKSGNLYVFSFYLIPLGIVTLLKAVIFR